MTKIYEGQKLTVPGYNSLGVLTALNHDMNDHGLQDVWWLRTEKGCLVKFGTQHLADEAVEVRP